jgi:FtsP/CotA-like multicopper oxidase with cupredoxin domain
MTSHLGAGLARSEHSRRLRVTLVEHPLLALLATAILSAAIAISATVVIGPGSSPGTGRPRANAGQAGGAIGNPLSLPGFRPLDLGRIWGLAFRGSAASYEPLALAETQADAIPADASIDPQTNTIRLTGAAVALTIVADPPNGREMAFRSAGLENPTIEVTRGALVTIRFINGDSDSAHGWLLLDPVVQIGHSFHGPRAFPDAYAPILGDPTSQGQPVETIDFRATTGGTYRYECPVPGHAAMGMQGAFTVTA